MTFEETKYCFVILFFIILMVFIPVFSQIKFSEIDADNFPKKIRVKHLSFLFKATGGRSVSKEGIIKPLFILQVTSYFIAFSTTIINIILFVFEYSLYKILLLTILILGIQIVLIILTMLILMLINKKRNNNSKYKLEREFIKTQVQKVVNKPRK